MFDWKDCLCVSRWLWKILKRWCWFEWYFWKIYGWGWWNSGGMEEGRFNVYESCENVY